MVIAGATALAMAGCGLGAGAGTSDVTMSVTRDFGTAPIGQVVAHRVPGSETVMRMLERHFRVNTRYGGGFVQSIDGLAGTSPRVDWFYYVNGVEAPHGAATTAVNKGDRIWWDLHDWTLTDSIPAVVGSFPEPFLHGVGGKRLPVTVECAAEASAGCKQVSNELGKLGVPFASQAIGGGSGTDSLSVEVGTWHELAPEVVAELIDQGPAASGVYARFTGGGASLELLDPGGQVVRRLGAGAGLVAATAQGGAPPTWVITGTDGARSGVRRAGVDSVGAEEPFRPGRPGSGSAFRSSEALGMTYRRRASPLHATRAGVGSAYCLALALGALLLSAPVMLVAVALTVLAAGAAAGVGRQMARAAVFAAVLGVAVALVNALVDRNGLTVIVRLGDLPILGHTDITLEATVYGAILGLRAAVLVLCGALYTLAVDPDEVLRLFRRVSFRSALTATLSTRMVPILLRDSHRLAEAQRCRPGPPPSRFQLMRAATAGVLDRALDVAAALEVRGYGAARRPPPARAPWSRHDLAFCASAVAVVGLAIGSRLAGLAPFQAYPSLRAPVGLGEVAVAVGLVVCALLPFADRRGIGG